MSCDCDPCEGVSFATSNREGIPQITHNSDEERFYLFDFSTFPEVAGGETISDPTGAILEPSSGGSLVLSDEQVTTSIVDSVPAGQGVLVKLSGALRGEQYLISCRVVFSGGSTASIHVRVYVE
jgi:hypothetical protein